MITSLKFQVFPPLVLITLLPTLSSLHPLLDQLDLFGGFLYHLTDAILPPRELDRRLQEDWGRDAREGPTVLMSLKVDFRPMTWAKYELTYLCILD